MIERQEQDFSEQLTDAGATSPERELEVSLRPKSLDDFVGQQEVKDGLSILLGAAKKREEPAEHVLLYGNPGLGKTTLAHIIAAEMQANIRVTSGPALERVGDLAAILSNLAEGDILFIDEIHRMSKTVEEVLYPAMEDFALDIIVGKGPTARTLRLNLERFTIIGATTRLSLLSSPLRDRFGAIYHLNFYEEDHISQIIARSAGLLEVEMDTQSVNLLSTRCRKTPRIANRLLRRVRDYAQVHGDGVITPLISQAALDLLSVDTHGLDPVDRHILTTIIEKFDGGPVGLGTLAAAIQEEPSTIEEVCEPFLIQLGMLKRTPRGRQATPRAYEHLCIDPSE